MLFGKRFRAEITLKLIFVDFLAMEVVQLEVVSEKMKITFNESLGMIVNIVKKKILSR